MTLRPTQSDPIGPTGGGRIEQRPPGSETANFDYSQWTDNDLVASLADDNAEAYAELYRRHASSVISAARVILRIGPDSEDVATEVFIQLWMSPENFDPNRGSLVGYLRMSAKRRSIDFLRSWSARKRREANDFYQVNLPPPDSDAKLIESEEADMVKQSIATLPAVEREAIETAFYKGMSYSAVAVHLGLPEGTVKARIRSGLRRLRMSDDIQLIRDRLAASIDSPASTQIVNGWDMA
jgi:RNA polymerase sigma-70 factor (ECF subfamily)